MKNWKIGVIVGGVAGVLAGFVGASFVKSGYDPSLLRVILIGVVIGFVVGLVYNIYKLMKNKTK